MGKQTARITKLLNKAVKLHGKDRVLEDISTRCRWYRDNFNSISQLRNTLNNKDNAFEHGHLNALENTLSALVPKEKRKKDYSHFSKAPKTEPTTDDYDI